MSENKVLQEPSSAATIQFNAIETINNEEIVQENEDNDAQVLNSMRSNQTS